MLCCVVLCVFVVVCVASVKIIWLSTIAILAQGRGRGKWNMSKTSLTHADAPEGLADNIISKQRDSVVFVAMRSCRTCKVSRKKVKV